MLIEVTGELKQGLGLGPRSTAVVSGMTLRHSYGSGLPRLEEQHPVVLVGSDCPQSHGQLIASRALHILWRSKRVSNAGAKLSNGIHAGDRVTHLSGRLHSFAFSLSQEMASSYCLCPVPHAWSTVALVARCAMSAPPWCCRAELGPLPLACPCGANKWQRATTTAEPTGAIILGQGRGAGAEKPPSRSCLRRLPSCRAR